MIVNATVFLGSVLGLQLTFNLYTAITLWAAGCAGIVAFARIGPRQRGALYWLLAGVGMLFLGADERLDFHERVGQRLEDWGLTIPGFHDLDGLVLIWFGLIGLAVSIAFRRELTANRDVLALLLAGAGFTLVAFALDDFTSNDGAASWTEERAEWLGSVCYLAAFARRAWKGWSSRVARGISRNAYNQRHGTNEYV